MKKKYWVQKCNYWLDWDWEVCYYDKDHEELAKALFENKSDARKFCAMKNKEAHDGK